MNKNIKFFILFFNAASSSLCYGMLKTKRHSASFIIPTTSIPIYSKDTSKLKRHSANSITSIDSSSTSPTDDNDICKHMAITSLTVNNIYKNGETALIWAARNNKSRMINALLEYPELDINKQNIHGKTALHYLSEHKNKNLITKLLKKHQTDASLTDNNNKTARDLIVGSDIQDLELRRAIFARITLDLTVNKKCNELKKMYVTNNPGSDANIDAIQIIDNAVQAIITNIMTTENKQKDYQPLPDSALLPIYANKEFIKKMLLLRYN